MDSSQYSTQKLTQTLIIQNCIMVDPKKEKDLEQFLYDGMFATLFAEKSVNQNNMKRRRVQSSSISCLPHFSTKGHSFQGKHAFNDFPTTFIDTSNCILLEQDFIDSIEELTQVKQENLVIGNDYAHNIKKLVQEKPRIEELKVPKSLRTLKDPLKSSQSLKSKTKAEKIKPTHKFLCSHIGGNSRRRPAIPIGPSFQADIPRWKRPH